ncbi:hypothetical protein LCGC14_0833110 [marine sediment metagenome]|uniref:Uncharacterized protein n=1 Tax=marine sediment metagenome TaxID=412755 RepID=A0A0F9KZR3_9ZZZZ
MVSDPIETVLQDLEKMRGAARNELLGLPAPHPLKDALLNIDRLLSQVEVDIRLVKAAVPPPVDIRDVTSRFSTWWGRGLSRYDFPGAAGLKLRPPGR